jgi:type III pantothenate kinase
MILLIDIGNSNITVGFYDGKIRDILRLNTRSDKRTMIRRIKGSMVEKGLNAPEGAVMCSVVPATALFMNKALKRSLGFEPLNVDPTLKLGLKFRINNSGELGSDRIVNAVAAHSLYRGHNIVVDLGTATTLCLISSRGEFMGGSIMPGLGVSADILAEKTAQLPEVKPLPPVQAVGKTTEKNILSGLFFGHAGAVERIIREMKMELDKKTSKAKTPVNVVITGGYSHILAPYIHVRKTLNPLLTLEGLRIIYELNV